MLELLVVMVIMGVLLGAALLGTSFSNMDRKLEEEGRRFTALLNYSREEAILQTRDLGLQIEDNTYRFLILDPHTNQWTRNNFDEVLRERTFPDDIRATLWIDGAGFDLGDPDEAMKESGNLPQVFILSSGEVSPFNLSLESDNAQSIVIIKAQMDGKTDLEIDKLGF